MNTKIVATNYQMQEWMDIIRNCRNSGLKTVENSLRIFDEIMTFLKKEE